uniref:Uncharacterized protein n=1 Tax=Setaria digitata TaxID=48799 RepID=A0A915PBM3_9BILA
MLSDAPIVFAAGDGRNEGDSNDLKWLDEDGSTLNWFELIGIKLDRIG